MAKKIHIRLERDNYFDYNDVVHYPYPYGDSATYDNTVWLKVLQKFIGKLGL